MKKLLSLIMILIASCVLFGCVSDDFNNQQPPTSLIPISIEELSIKNGESYDLDGLNIPVGEYSIEITGNSVIAIDKVLETLMVGRSSVVMKSATHKVEFDVVVYELTYEAELTVLVGEEINLSSFVSCEQDVIYMINTNHAIANLTHSVFFASGEGVVQIKGTVKGTSHNFIITITVGKVNPGNPENPDDGGDEGGNNNPPAGGGDNEGDEGGTTPPQGPADPENPDVGGGDEGGNNNPPAGGDDNEGDEGGTTPPQGPTDPENPDVGGGDEGGNNNPPAGGGDNEGDEGGTAPPQDPTDPENPDDGENEDEDDNGPSINIEQSIIAIEIGQTVILNATILPEDYEGAVVYSIVSGNSSVSLKNNVLKGRGMGTAKVLATIKGTDVSVEITVVVSKISCNILCDDVVAFISETVELEPTLDTNNPQELFYTLITGSDCIQLSGNQIKAVSAGTAIVKITMSNSDAYKYVTVTVKGYPYQLVCDTNILIEPNWSRRISIVVYSQFSQFVNDKHVKHEILEGEEYISYDHATSVLKGISQGVAKIRFYVEGEKEIIVTVTVQRPSYTLSLDTDVDITVGESYEIAPIVYPELDDKPINIRLISGLGIVSLDRFTVHAISEGKAQIACYVENEYEIVVNISVNKPYCEITLPEVLYLYETQAKTLEMLVEPNSADISFEITDVDGVITFDRESMTVVGNKVGTAQIKAYYNKNPLCFATTLVEVSSLLREIPSGYVKLNDYLYVSHKPGVYSYSFTLRVFTPYKDAKIRYTTDSSPVTLSSVVCDRLLVNAKSSATYMLTPLMHSVDGILTWAGTNKNYHSKYVDSIQNTGNYPTIPLGNVYNFAVERGGKLVASATATYIVTGKNYYYDYPVLSLSMPYSEWFDSTTDGTGTALYNNIRSDIAKRVNLEFFDGNEFFSVNSQIKLGGGWSLGFPQRTMHLNFSKDENGVSQKVDFEIFGNNVATEDGEGLLDSFKRFRLHNSGSDHDGANGSAIVNDVLIHELAKNMTNVSTTEYRPCIVFLNGEYWGYYALREHYSAQYFASNFHVNKDDVEYVDYVGGYRLEDGDAEDWSTFESSMTEYLNTQNFAIESVYDEFVRKYIDVDSYIDLLLIQGYADNWDFMANGNNFRMWRVKTVDPNNRYADGRLRFSLHDLDMCLTTSYNNANRFAQKNSAYMASRSEHSYQNYIMTAKLFCSEKFRNALYARLDYIANTVFRPSRVDAMLTDLYDELLPLWSDSAARWAWALSCDNVKSRMNKVRDFINNRYSWFNQTTREILGIMDESYDDCQDGIDFDLFQYFEGNGSQNPKVFSKANGDFSSNDFTITYTHINNGIYSISGQYQYHVKFVYGSSNYVIRVLKGGASQIWIDKISDTSAYTTTTETKGPYNLSYGAHKYKIVKSGTNMKVYVDGTLALNRTVPSSEVVRIELYQHTSNAKYRNFKITPLS